MKKSFCKLSILLMLMMLNGCSGSQNTDAPVPAEEIEEESNGYVQETDSKGKVREIDDQISFDQAFEDIINLREASILFLYEGASNGKKEHPELIQICVDDFEPFELDTQYRIQFLSYLGSGMHVIKAESKDGKKGEFEFEIKVDDYRPVKMGISIRTEDGKLIIENAPDKASFAGREYYSESYIQISSDKSVFPSETAGNIGNIRYSIPIASGIADHGNDSCEYPMDDYYGEGTFIYVKAEEIDGQEWEAASEEEILYNYVKEHIVGFEDAYSVQKPQILSSPGLRFLYDVPLEDPEMADYFGQYGLEHVTEEIISFLYNRTVYSFVLNLYPFSNQLQDAIGNAIIESIQPFTMSGENLLYTMVNTYYCNSDSRKTISILPPNELERSMKSDFRGIDEKGNEFYDWAFLKFVKETEDQYVLKATCFDDTVMEIRVDKDDLSRFEVVSEAGFPDISFLGSYAVKNEAGSLPEGAEEEYVESMEETETGTQGDEEVSVGNLDGCYYRSPDEDAIISVKTDGDQYYVTASTSYYDHVAWIEGSLEMVTGTTGRLSQEGYTMTIIWDNPDSFRVQEDGEPGGMGTTFEGEYYYFGPVE